LTGWRNLELYVSIHQTVNTLFADETDGTPLISHTLTLSKMPGRVIGAPRMENLPLLSQQIKGLPQRFPGYRSIDVMTLVDINVVGLQSL
tara:strand:+ start:149 stop:418 length:270 start_codon:yes stop_codon:yes gene_type:complete